jgi:hypothetical protein
MSLTESIPLPPNLGSVISTADVSRKGTGSYAADYINWCRTGQLLREHAPGWQFHLRPTAEGQHIWAAPNGTGYVVGYFIGPEGQITPDFPQAVMDNRNAPVALERISARDVTDTHRRCLCTCAAAMFGLAWQLWAREPIEDPHREEPAPTAKPYALTTPGELAAGALKAAMASGLSPEGITAFCQEVSEGKASTLAELPENALARLAKSGLHQTTVARCNAAAAPAEPEEEEEDDDDLPASWAA